MAERSMAAVLKTVSGVTHSGVRIPLPPPFYLFFISRYCIARRVTQLMTPSQLTLAS